MESYPDFKSALSALKKEPVFSQALQALKRGIQQTLSTHLKRGDPTAHIAPYKKRLGQMGEPRDGAKIYEVSEV